jgi:hypothetical protein
MRIFTSEFFHKSSSSGLLTLLVTTFQKYFENSRRYSGVNDVGGEPRVVHILANFEKNRNGSQKTSKGPEGGGR